MSMVEIKGSVLRTRLALVEDLAPKGGLPRVLARLEEGERAILTSLLASAWYPFALGQRLDQAIVDVLVAGRPEFSERLGGASAEKNLGPGGVHRSFLAKGDLHAFLARVRPWASAWYGWPC